MNEYAPYFHKICKLPLPISAKFIIFPLYSFNLHIFGLTFTPSESAPSGQFWCIYALIGGERVILRFFLPYFDHDAFMHQALLVLNAPEFGRLCLLVSGF